MSTNPGEPRSLRREDERRVRRERLKCEHMSALVAYRKGLQCRWGPDWEIPDFDPADGGIRASLLFLAEKPGRMATSAGSGRKPGSGFISLDNNDETAAAGHGFIGQAGISRSDIVRWNLVPGWNGTRDITANERKRGLDALAKLLLVLSNLKGVMLVGENAQRAGPFLEQGLPVFTSYHPSPIVRATNREKWESIPRAWRAAGLELGLVRPDEAGPGS